MSTFLFDKHVFGPIQSRRLGSSLGINLLSTSQKVCNFDCIYCECGELHAYNDEALFVPKDEFYASLKTTLQDCIEQQTPIDTITFAGNGEPTLHPDFPAIVEIVVTLRNLYFPKAEIAVLTNGATLKNNDIAQALERVDKAIIKLDAGTEETIQQIDEPKKPVQLGKFIEELSAFKGQLCIQTMFLRGTVNNTPVDNTQTDELKKWLHCIEQINPSEVMIYSLDRDTPIDTLEAVPKSTLNSIAKHVESLGIKTLVV